MTTDTKYRTVVIVTRDPDASNWFDTFGEVDCYDIDLGYMDLSDPIEWAEWIESREYDYRELIDKNPTAAAAYAQTIAEHAPNFGQPVPEWARAGSA